MRRTLPILCLPVLALSAWLLSASVPKVAPAVPGAIPQTGRVPVLVELFTSEACTICPAAGDVLRTLEQKQPIPGVEVIGIEMRMDSWSAQGFRDPFALRQMTNRQNEYLRLFKLDNLFTPQMVIGGQSQLAGPDVEQAKDEIARMAKSQRATVEVSFQSASMATVKVDKLPSSAGESEIWMAVTESQDGDGAAGSALGRTGVVRSLVMLGLAQPGELTTYSMHLRFNPRWRREDLKYVVFVQERISRRIWGATAVIP
jgi:hypothetical protein